MKVIECVQRSPEWHAARLGRLTGSRVGEAFAKLKSGGEASGRRNLRMQLTLERLTGQSQDSTYTNADMQRGIELEDEALAVYQGETGVFVDAVGFIAHDELMAGCSPDGLVGEDGMVEVKAPRPAVHLDYVRGGLPMDYRLQIVHGLWLTGRAWCDFVSYCPQFPEWLRLKRTRVLASECDLFAHDADVRAFLEECDREHEAILKLREGVAA